MLDEGAIGFGGVDDRPAYSTPDRYAPFLFHIPQMGLLVDAGGADRYLRRPKAGGEPVLDAQAKDGAAWGNGAPGPRGDARRRNEMTNAASAQGLKQIGFFDCPGGGQVVVDGHVAYIAHMKAPHGTTLVDVRDPASPRQLATLEVPAGTHSHKVRAANGLMLVNREAHGAHPGGGVTGAPGHNAAQAVLADRRPWRRRS